MSLLLCRTKLNELKERIKDESQKKHDDCKMNKTFFNKNIK